MQFFLITFPPDLGGKILWPQGENFLPGFPLPLFSPYSQTVENSVFLLIFFISLKSTQPNTVQVLFAEADKELIDFFITILALLVRPLNMCWFFVLFYSFLETENLEYKKAKN